MSHFTVLVKVTADRLKRHSGDLCAALAEMLGPFQENNGGDCPKQFLEFHDEEDDYRNSYENKTVTKVVMPDGRLLNTWDEEFRVPNSGRGIGSETHRVPADLEQREVPFRELYSTFEEYMQDWCSEETRDTEKGRYGYWENPNAKWDWWTVGGRWRGLLRVKDAATSAHLGELSYVFKPEFNSGKEHQDRPNKADIAKIEDIDFEGMEFDVDEKISDFWGKVSRLAELGLIDPSATTVTIGYTEEQKAAAKALIGDEVWFDHDVHYGLVQIGLRSREDSNQPFNQTPFTLDDLMTRHRWYWGFYTYAVLDDGGWHSKGKMGWFGCGSDTTPDREHWGKTYVERFLKSDRPDTTLVVVDCHI